ncbi:hypothetical protein [Streptosporangium lutulentum]|uniref:HD domain-containing protein n=1 Tax=Streptosporangium lutulentum TaxID=1461250 RepID=A0ABT9QMT3_9ACTN|nr:hypothetical protein [Streptosporangium lutulentum]MDP9847563.1 hypothetical protein [Streptosporangium lutulentum]
MAVREGTGQHITVAARQAKDVPAVIRDWEKLDRARMLHDLGELGRLVDQALAKVKMRASACVSYGDR